MSFDQFSLHERIHRALESAGFTTPTPIQASTIPPLLEGHDLVGTAQTGTGKTAAYVLPILQRLLENPRRMAASRALILAPTRELAEQIHAAIQQLGEHTTIRSATVYGGVGMLHQERALRKGVDIIVACPGRLIDHIGRGNANLDHIECLVLDEADRMLDMGFMPPIKQIINLLPKDRQTMLFSATFAKELQSFVDGHLRNPKRVDIGLAAPAETVEHALYPVPGHLKTALLTEMLKRMDTDSVLIFTRTKHRANRVSEQLTRSGYEAGVLHANKSQNHRQATLDNFRAGELRILVATDIAARGIDVTTISHVINYDIPDCADTYIHRIGRTGRMERSGEALTFVTLDDVGIIKDIERALGERIETCTIDNFDYTKPGPKVDEFKRPPRPPRPPQKATKKAEPKADMASYAPVQRPKNAAKPQGQRPADAGRPSPGPRPPRSHEQKPRPASAAPPSGRSRHSKGNEISYSASRGRSTR